MMYTRSRKRRLLQSVAIVVLAAGVASSGAAQSHPPARPANAARPLTADQALPLTCAQAWATSHKRYPEMLAIVTTLAKISLANRDLTVPNRRDVGIDAGEGIAEDCKADPDALLFAVVDRHVRRVAQVKGR